ncbi:hypothetical protein C8R43DRAFT_1031458 [Mycena crocata]|nr:hypothetical protein C8R43DRAFT_1031458 [Mycena crocata]
MSADSSPVLSPAESERFTPFSKEFLENHRLSAGEMKQVNQIVSAGELKLLDLDTSISRAKIELDQLTKQREEVQQQVALHKSVLCFIDRVPPEILSKILALTTRNVDDDELDPTPWHLGHISQYWRKVALAVQILWADIFIDRTAKFPIEKLKTQLARAANCRLKIIFMSSSSRDAHAAALLQLLVDRSAQWRATDILVTPDNYGILAAIRGRLHQLCYLRLNVVDFSSYGGRGSSSTQQIHPFELAPELRSLAVEDVSGIPYSLRLPFDQLTHLKVTFTRKLPFATLHLTPNLETASLDFMRDPDPSEAPVRLPRLRGLYISTLDALDLLQLPALEELYMIGTAIAPLLRLLARSLTAKLKTLRIMGCNGRDIAAILHAAPTIQTLAVQVGPNEKSDDLVRQLTVRLGAGCIGPTVDSVCFALDQGVISQRLFFDMLDSRWRVPAGGPCCRLRAAEILMLRGDFVFAKGIEKRMKALRAEGLHISILEGVQASNAHFEWRY